MITPGRRPTEPLQILVIEDETTVRETLTQYLDLEGHTVYAFGSAEDALEQLPFTTFEVSFLDYHLPGMDGLILGDYLLKNNPNMTIALMCGSIDERQLQRLSEKHRMAFLPKPFEREQVLDVLTEFLERRVERVAEQAQSQEENFAPRFAPYLGELASLFEMPNIPQRIEEQLVSRTKECMNRLRTERRFNEADRVGALVGLLCARLLGASLAHGAAGQTLEEEFDELMHEHGLRCEFRANREET